MTPPLGDVVVDEEQILNGRTERIETWAIRHSLSAEEITRIQSAFSEPDDEVDDAMLEELEGVLAARRIASMKKPTVESMKAIGAAFGEGRLPVKSLPMD